MLGKLFDRIIYEYLRFFCQKFGFVQPELAIVI